MKIELHGGTMTGIKMFLAALKWLQSNRHVYSTVVGSFSGPKFLNVRSIDRGIYNLWSEIDNGFVCSCECIVDMTGKHVIPQRIELQLWVKGGLLADGPQLEISCSDISLVETVTGDKELALSNVVVATRN